MDTPILTARDSLTSLTPDEVDAFFQDLDKDRDGFVTFDELEAKLHEVHEELAPEPQAHHLHHPDRRDLEKSETHAGDGLHAFLCSLMGDCGSKLSKAEFTERVNKWQIPSQKQTDSKQQDDEDRACEHRIPWRRRLRAYWAVHGPMYCFMAFVIALQIAFGLWQFLKYLRSPAIRAALGWGVVVAKLAAGVLYPTLFFMLLSMSRHFSTFLRRGDRS